MVSHMTKMGLLLTIPLAIVYGITYFFGPLLFYYKPRGSPARIYYRVPEIYPSYNKGDLVIAKLPDMIQTDAPFIFRQMLVCQTYVTPCLMKSWSVSFGDFHPSGRIGKQL